MEALAEVLAQEDTVLFVGSGISMWSGLPSWWGMLEELAKFIEKFGGDADLVRAELTKGDALQAASYGFDKLTKHQAAEFIRLTCRYGRAKPHEIHRKIVSLGPRCYITTNYDDLIEQSLRLWQPDVFFRPTVTNRHLTETAELVHARSTNFVFKPHGDASDAESIILTREHYRSLLPQGDRQAALESLKMLLASRPVVYLGFGLRDPDFAYLRDVLANTYKGAVRDHYAIMADVSGDQIAYWRRAYGIHLVSYPTADGTVQSRDHSALLNLLDRLLEKRPRPHVNVMTDPHSPSVVLSLARYAAGLSRTPKANPELPIRIHTHRENQRSPETNFHLHPYEHSLVEKFLDSGPARALLIGLPGSGKSYSLHQAAARLAETLHQSCLSENFNSNQVIVPIVADLKLYRGNVYDLISSTLPNHLPLQWVMEHFPVRIFLDSFNEMPREYLEGGRHESDLKEFISTIKNASLVIGSRTTDGLNSLALPSYELNEIDHNTVRAELEGFGVPTDGRFGRELVSLMARPFYFRYLINGSVDIRGRAHPKDFYEAFFNTLQQTFSARFVGIDIQAILSLTAYDALNRGEEAFALTELLSIVDSLGIEPISNSGGRDIANWLVSSSVLIPYIGGRIAFVHQSITEYLAAKELAIRYQASPHILFEKISLMRWDQALFLTLSLLPADRAGRFIQDIVEADVALAFRAAKYLEFGRDELVSHLLEYMLEHPSHPLADRIAWSMEADIPLSDVHLPLLRRFIELGGQLGAAAAERLIEMKGTEVKQELLPKLFERPGDYSLCCNGIGPNLKKFATTDDAHQVVRWADLLECQYDSDDEDAIVGFTSGAGAFLASLDVAILRETFIPKDQAIKLTRVRSQVLCNVLSDYRERIQSTDALSLAADLLLLGVDDAATSIYFVGSRPSDDIGYISWNAFNSTHIDRLVSLLKNESDAWAADSLELICAARSDLADIVRQKAETESGILRVVLLRCVTLQAEATLFSALADLTTMPEDEFLRQPLSILDHMELDWTGKEDLFVRLLKMRNISVANALFGGSSPPTIKNLGTLDIGRIEWWLEWMLELDASSNDTFWFQDQLAGLFAGHLETQTQKEFVSSFNDPQSRFRGLLLRRILPVFPSISTDALSEEAISYALADLNRARISSFRNHLFGAAATEGFVVERLLPLIAGASEPLLGNLQEILRQAGSRHGRRYALSAMSR